MSKETSALCGAVTQWGVPASHRMREHSMDVWTVWSHKLTVTGHVNFFFCSEDVSSLNCQKQPGHMAVSFNSVLLHNWTQHWTGLRDLGNLSLSSALIASFLSQGERSDVGIGSWWILRFHGPVFPWAAWRLKLCHLEKFCTGATPAGGMPAPA